MKTLARVLCTLPLLFALHACDRPTRYRLVSETYGFSVEFPEKPIEQSDMNYQGLPKSLWTAERDTNKEFYSTEVTTYKEALRPSSNWIPGQELDSRTGTAFLRPYPNHGIQALHVACGIDRAGSASDCHHRKAGFHGRVAVFHLYRGWTDPNFGHCPYNEQHQAAFLNSLTLLR